MAGRVLTPLDGSRFGEFALPFAASIADRTRWNLQLFHVHIPDPRNRRLPPPADTRAEPVPTSPRERMLRARRAYLRQAARRVGLSEESVSAVVAEGQSVADTIRRHAEDVGTDLIVMSTHGRTGVDRLWLGSVADALVRSTRIPVLLVRPSPDERRSQELDSVSRVLVPLDSSPACDRILAPALALGEALGWSFLLLHVIPTHLVFGARSFPIPSGQVEEQRREAREFVEAVCGRFRDRGVDHDVRLVEDEAPARAILRTLSGDRIDLVSMATPGHGGITRAILGSVVDRVVQATSLPLLLAGPGAAPATAH